jgi:hypothetical protein
MAELNLLNSNNSLDFLHKFSETVRDDIYIDNPYLNVHIDSKFYDVNSLLLIPNITNSPVYISLNIQSLNSKIDSLRSFIIDLADKKVNVEIIAIQECWSIEYPDLVQISGYHPFISNQRVGMRGGGVGFFYKKHHFLPKG